MIELLVVIGIAGILVALAMPSFSLFLDRQKISTLTEEFSSSVIVARSAAIKSGIPVILCASSDGSSCGVQWDDGWIAFRDDDRDAVFDVAEPIVLMQDSASSNAGISVVSLAGDDVNAVGFNYRGAPDSALSVSVSRGEQSQLMSISPFGKTRHHD